MLQKESLKEILIKLNRATVRNILLELPDYKPAVVRFRPAKRFEMENVGELVQLDTSSSSGWFFYLGKKLIHCIVCLDDHSRKVLAGHFFEKDDVYSNMLLLREGVEKYRVFEIAYTDCDSKFKFNPRKPSMYQTVIVTPDEVITQIKHALLKIGSTLLTHSLGNTRATGKIEKWFQFLQSWFCTEYQFKNLPLSELDKEFQDFIEFYNNRFHEGIKETPNRRFQRALEERKTRLHPLPKDVNLDDIFCLTETRGLKKDNTFSYNGSIYDLTRNRRSITPTKLMRSYIFILKRRSEPFTRENLSKSFPMPKRTFKLLREVQIQTYCYFAVKNSLKPEIQAFTSIGNLGLNVTPPPKTSRMSQEFIYHRSCTSLRHIPGVSPEFLKGGNLER